MRARAWLAAASVLCAWPAMAQDNPARPGSPVRLSPAQLETIRLNEIARAAQLYTGIAFSPRAIGKLRSQLPLDEAAFGKAIDTVQKRFEACMEGALEARLDNAYKAQVLRKTVQSARSKAVPEPRDAKIVLPAFQAANAFCSGRIDAWLASQIQ